MKNVNKVVAQPGSQILLEIGGRKLVITAFEAVDLSEMFSEDVIDKCTALTESLRQKFLVEFTGQALPSDPNAQYIAELRHSASQHIQTNYSQTGSHLNKNTQVVTDAEPMTEEFKQNLLDQVEKSKAEILATNNSFLSKSNDAYEDVDKDPVERKNPLTSNELTMRVSMDIPHAQFLAKQKADAAALAEKSVEKPLPTNGVMVPERLSSDTEED